LALPLASDFKYLALTSEAKDLTMARVKGLTSGAKAKDLTSEARPTG